MIANVDIDNPGPNEVLVNVAATGLCHTGLHFLQEKLPLSIPSILGHESAGTVATVGSSISYVSSGDHVVMCLSAFCGHCEFFLPGTPSICENGDQLVRFDEQPPRISQDQAEVTQFMNLSAFAEQVLVHEHSLVKIDKAMPLDIAALIGCGVLTGIGAVTRTANIEFGSSVVILGCGAVGLSAIQGARMPGTADIIAVDLNDDRLEMAEKLGATYVINSSRLDPVEEAQKLMGGRGVHYAFEAVGMPRLVKDGFSMLRKGGSLVIVGLMPADSKVTLPVGHFLAERSVMECDMGSNRFRTDVPNYVQLYLDGRLKLDDMLSRRIALDQINEGFSDMEKGVGIRTIIDFSL